MSQDTSVRAQNARTSNSLLTFENGQPFVSSAIVAREFGRLHKNVLRTLDSLIEDETIDRLEFEPISYIDDQGREQRAIQLNEDGFLIAMPFIGGRKARQGQRKLVKEFGKLRSQAAPLPPPTPNDPITKEVRTAINRRAHALSLRHYDRIRDDLADTLRRHAERFPKDRDLVAFVERIDLPDSVLVCVHRSDLWHLCSVVASMATLQARAMDSIHALEAATGRQWYGRPANTENSA